jgi:hypothetical protein
MIFTEKEPTMASNDIPFNWDHADPTLVSTRRRVPRNERQPIYPTNFQITEIHPEIKNMPCLRHRGRREYISSQRHLEIERQEGLRNLEKGIFYCYSEEEYDDGNGSLIVVRFGNMFGGNHWIYKIAAFPKYHPDGEQVPYKMKNVS